MVILLLVFVIIIACSYLSLMPKIKTVSDVGIISPAQPVVTQIPLSPTPIDPFVEKGKNLIEDLEKINIDLQKIKIEDNRFISPDFLFEKDFPQ
jgi:hypothetical protein